MCVYGIILIPMAEPKIRTTIEFDPYDFERLRAFADKQDVGLATAIIGLLDGKRIRVPFTPPTPEELRDHCLARGYTFDPEAFHAFYQSKGWKVGSQMMRDWKAACVTWQKREPVSSKPVIDKADGDRAAEEQRLAFAEIEEMRRARRAAGLD
jgi:hypothetical protein